jgi:DNA-binding transcriptional LysR family regulator
VELRQLEAFVAVATELHFGRAAERLRIAQPTLSEMIRRLEREMGSPLLTRTTRRVSVTDAGSELLERATGILRDVEAAAVATRTVGAQSVGRVRLGITPPAAPVLAPHLVESLRHQEPDLTLSVQRMWLPALTHGLRAGEIDVGLTCGVEEPPEGLSFAMWCGEPLLVALRPGDHLGGTATVHLEDLADRVLGLPSDVLFPAWALAQRQALTGTPISPPTRVLESADVSGSGWVDQDEVEWIMLIDSLSTTRTSAIVRPVTPTRPVPFCLLWHPQRGRRAVTEFVASVLSSPLPAGWMVIDR